MMESWNVGIVGDEGKDNYVRVETRFDRHPKINLRLAISPTKSEEYATPEADDYGLKEWIT